MANIIPITTATGSAPLMLNEMKGNTEAGGAANIGTLKSTSDKGSGGLHVLAAEKACAFQVNDNVVGQNGRRYNAGLSNTDLSNAICGYHITGNALNRIDINTVANKGLQVHLGSTAGSYSNYRSWTVRGNDSSIGGFLGYEVYVLDPSISGTEADTGTYNNSSLSMFAITANTQGGYSSNYSWWFGNKFFRVIKSKAGACGIYGVSPSFQDYHNNAVTEAWTLFSVAPSVFRVVTPFKIGDGVTTTTFTDPASTLFTPSGKTSGGVDQFHTGASSYPFYLDLTTNCGVVLNATVFNWGEACLFDFDVNSTATVELNGCIFNGMGEFTLGSSVVGASLFTLASGNKVLINGANLNGSTFNNDVELLTETDLTDITVNGDLTIAGGIDMVLALSGSHVSGNIINNNAGNTLTVNLVNGATATTTEPGTGVGLVNIVNPATLGFTVSPSITGYEWRLYEKNVTDGIIGSVELAGEETATQDNQSYGYNYLVDTDCVLQIIADGYEESLTYFVLGDSDQNLTIVLNVENNT